YILNMSFELLFHVVIQKMHNFHHFSMQRFKALAHTEDNIHSSFIDPEFFDEFDYQIEPLNVLIRIEPLVVYTVRAYKSFPLVHAQCLWMDFKYSRHNAYHVYRAAFVLPLVNPHDAPFPSGGLSYIKILSPVSPPVPSRVCPWGPRF